MLMRRLIHSFCGVLSFVFLTPVFLTLVLPVRAGAASPREATPVAAVDSGTPVTVTTDAHVPALPGTGADAGRIVLYRDTWGVAHIYAPTVDDGLYAQGYAQAEDRPEQLLMNFKMAMGELTEVMGQAGETASLLSLLFDHYGIAQRALALQSPQARQPNR